MNWRHVVAGAIVLFLLGLVIGMIDIPTNSTKKEIPTASSVIANKKGVLPPYVLVDQKIFSTLGTEVVKNVFDDGQGNVYIRADFQWMNFEEEQLADILTKKRNWEKQFRSKKVTTMSIVTGNGGMRGSSFIAGLLIQYEQRQ